MFRKTSWPPIWWRSTRSSALNPIGWSPATKCARLQQLSVANDETQRLAELVGHRAGDQLHGRGGSSHAIPPGQAVTETVAASRRRRGRQHGRVTEESLGLLVLIGSV